MKTTVPDAIWPTDNDLGIPNLLLELCADALDIPVRGWGSVRRGALMPGTWHLYVDDYRFTALWKDPSKVIATKAVNCVEPNFTVHDQLPRAVVQWNTRFLLCKFPGQARNPASHAGRKQTPGAGATGAPHRLGIDFGLN